MPRSELAENDLTECSKRPLTKLQEKIKAR